jgi:cysteine-rich repeat protein
MVAPRRGWPVALAYTVATACVSVEGLAPFPCAEGACPLGLACVDGQCVSEGAGGAGGIGGAGGAGGGGAGGSSGGMGGGPPPGCGNGTKDAGEACDDGNATDGDGCDSNCTLTGCGNGVVTQGETCDDGNQADGDGCEASCLPTPCSAPWACWPMPTPVGAGLPNEASYVVDVIKAIVTDAVTGLMWERVPSAASYTWAEAAAYCEGLSFSGFANWRLPTRIELVSLTSETRRNPAIDIDAFPDAPAATFWTSSPVANLPQYAWTVLFNDGYASYQTVSTQARVRCVR